VARELTLQTQAAPAAPEVPALSSCLTQWPLALRSFSNPRPHGLHRPAQRRWTILLSRAVAVAAHQMPLREVVLVDLELELLLALQQARHTL